MATASDAFEGATLCSVCGRESCEDHFPETPRPQPASLMITLRGAPPVPRAALDLLWDLERRGFALSVRDDQLYVRPKVSADDRAAIIRLRDEILLLVKYCEVIQ